MVRRFVVLILTLLFGLPTAAGAVLHRCGGELVEHCACDHGAELSAGDDACCSQESIAASPAFVLSDAGAAVLLEPTAVVSIPRCTAPAAELLPVAAPVAPPVRGPPRIPIFLQNCVLLN